MDVSKNRGGPPKWMVKIVEKPYFWMDDLGGTIFFWKHPYIYICIPYIYLEPQWPLFLKVNPPKQGPFHSKQGAPFGFQVYISTPIYSHTWYTFVLGVKRLPAPRDIGQTLPGLDQMPWKKTDEKMAGNISRTRRQLDVLAIIGILTLLGKEKPWKKTKQFCWYIYFQNVHIKLIQT